MSKLGAALPKRRPDPDPERVCFCVEPIDAVRTVVADALRGAGSNRALQDVCLDILHLIKGL